MHVTASPAIWYAARASGVAAYVVLTVVVCVGMAPAFELAVRRSTIAAGQIAPPVQPPPVVTSTS